MLHRISIFDLATLEMMRIGKPIILSKQGGNLSFNKKANIIFTEGPKWQLNNKLCDLKHYGELNKEVFEVYFSKEAFKERYISMINRANNTK